MDSQNMTIPAGFYPGDVNSLNQIEPPVEVVATGSSLFGSLTSGKDNVIDASMVNTEEVVKKKRKNKTKKVGDSEIVLRDGGETVKNEPLEVSDYTNTYQDTTSMLKGTIAQIDQLSVELKHDIDTARAARTMKGKYKIITDLNSAMGQMLGTKVQAIKEINNSIKIANDMNYRKMKDIKAADAENDDKYIMDMYSAYVKNPYGMKASSVPSLQDMTLYGAGHVNNLTAVDVGAPVSAPTFVPSSSDVPMPGTVNNPINLTPEQNLMYHESDPNIQMCVVYDKATMNKWFQVMNIATKEPVPNMPAKDPMFLEDTTIDVRNGIARNTNLNETYPLIIINEDKFKDF